MEKIELFEQYETATDTREFLTQWGLKKKFVASICGIPETVFSKFINGKMALNNQQLARLIAYTDEYIRRNG